LETSKSKTTSALIRYKLVIAPAALLDISSGFNWYKDKSLTAADGFRKEVFDAIEYVGIQPLRQTEDHYGDRRWLLNRFPYTVVYCVAENQVTIIAVAHNRRAPNYWKKPF
jgi:plasmid stabilization system protein ParE